MNGPALDNWAEYDYNPFILFDSNGKIVTLNKEAQYLLGKVTPKEIFQIARSYASMTYGYKTTLLDLNFGTYKFYGFTVGYENEEHIGIKLYKHTAQAYKTPKAEGDKINIYTVLDLCISAASTNSKTKFLKEFDPTFPNMWLKLDMFMKLLTKSYQCYKDSETILTKLFLKTGEYIKFEDKKYPIFNIELSGENRAKTNETDMQKLAFDIGSNVSFASKSLTISSPLINAEK